MERLLILGLDPGTTLGYAILSIDGSLLMARSEKDLSMDSLISFLIKKGIIVLIGSDKKNVPNYVRKVAARLGSKIISPKEDLLIKEKKNLTREFNLENKHERDAVAAAIFAFKKVRNLLRKIDIYVAKENKSDLANFVKKIVLTNDNVSIYSVLSNVD